MNTPKIEKGIPIPERSSYPGAGLTSLLKSMKVGDSVVLKANRNSVYATAGFNNFKVAIRKVSNTEIRIWRIK